MLKVEGVDIVVANMGRFNSLAKSEVQIAVRKTAIDIHRAEVKYADMKTKRRTGGLTRIMLALTDKDTAVVEPTAPYAPYIEYGTRPHRIRARNKRVLAARVKGARAKKLGLYTFFGKEVEHPGTAARPFVAPARAYGEKQMMKHMEAALNKALPK